MIGTLKCTTPGHIYMLMKSSTLMLSDYIDEPISEPYLVLRKYYPINNSTEFRCFIINKELVGISQRYCSVYYEFLNNFKEKYIDIITNFYNNIIKDTFDELNYTLDLYIDKREKIWIIDFGDLNEDIDTCLFDYNELKNFTTIPVYRVVECKTGIIPSNRMFYQLPLELQGIDQGIEEYISDLRDKMKNNNL